METNHPRLQSCGPQRGDDDDDDDRYFLSNTHRGELLQGFVVLHETLYLPSQVPVVLLQALRLGAQKQKRSMTAHEYASTFMQQSSNHVDQP
jgi:hypothetical protein